MFFVWKGALRGGPWGPVSWLVAEGVRVSLGRALRRAGKPHRMLLSRMSRRSQLGSCPQVAPGDLPVTMKAQLAQDARPGFLLQPGLGMAPAKGLEEPRVEVCPGATEG